MILPQKIAYLNLATSSGGEAMTIATNAATNAAKEAASGAWLKELQSRHLPRVLAPGMPHGIFGPWQEEGILLTVF